MKTRNERIEALAERWLTAQATDAEERALRELVREGEELPEAFGNLGLLLGGLDALASETLPAERPFTLPVARRPLRRIVPAVFAVAAAIAVGVFTWLQLRKPYCYIDGRAIYNKEVALSTTVYLDGFAQFDDPIRLLDRLMDNDRPATTSKQTEI